MKGCCRRSSRNEGEVRILGMREGRGGVAGATPARGGRRGLESVVSGQHVFSSAVGLQGFCGVDILRQLRFASHHRPLLPLLVLQLGRDGGGARPGVTPPVMRSALSDSYVFLKT